MAAQQMASHPAVTLKDVRKATGLTVRQTAAAVGIPPATYHYYEHRVPAQQLPADLAERLEPVFHEFGIDRRYVRALSASAAHEAANAVTADALPPLKPVRLTTFEKALVRRRIEQWREDQDSQERDRLLKMFEPTSRRLVEQVQAERGLNAMTQELRTEASMALMISLDRYDAQGTKAFDRYIEENILARLNQLVDDLDGQLRLGPNRTPGSDRLLRRVSNDLAAAPDGPGDRPIPVYYLKPGPRRGFLVLSGVPIAWCRRPPGLLEYPLVFGFVLRYDGLSPRYEHDDLLIVNPHRAAPPGDEALITEPRSGDRIDALIARVAEAPTGLVSVASLDSKGGFYEFGAGRVGIYSLARLRDLLDYRPVERLQRAQTNERGG